MERISIFNYEAFYLDFLEGNLSEEDTSLLFAFLKLHPELEIELDDLPVIDESLVKIDSIFLDSLKQTDFASDKITLANAESFMIASFEGQLSEPKEKELLILLNANPSLATEFAQVQQLTLTADKSIVYPDKGALIQRKKIVLWPYVAAAASVLIFLFIYQGIQTNKTPSTNFTARSTPKSKKEPTKNGTDDLIEKNSNNQKSTEDNQNIAFNGKVSVQKKEYTNVDATNTSNKPQKSLFNKNSTNKDLEIAKLNKKKAQLNQAKTPELIDRVPVKNDQAIAQVNPTKSADYSSVGMNDMNNPIKPITNRLSELTKTEIDVRTAQGNTNKRKGFYLKIGKFEIERKGN